MKSAVKKFKGLSDKAIAWIFITPTLILLLAINIYPLIYAIRMSFTNFYANKIGREPKFVGLKNYKKILGKEEIWEKMQITAHFVCWTLITTKSPPASKAITAEFQAAPPTAAMGSEAVLSS